jgi:hypothetical protein
MTFPEKATVMLSPFFDEKVIAAVDSFPDYHLVEPEEITHHIMYPWEFGDDAPQPFNELGASDLGLILEYIDGNVQNYVLNLHINPRETVKYRCCRVCGV